MNILKFADAFVFSIKLKNIYIIKFNNIENCLNMQINVNKFK